MLACYLYRAFAIAQSRTAPLPMRSAPSAEPTVDAVLRARHAGCFELFATGTVRLISRA